MRPEPLLRAVVGVLLLLVTCDCAFPSPFPAASAKTSARSTRATPAPSAKSVFAAFLIWVGIIILGRLIAYDHIWGPWSPATKA